MIDISGSMNGHKIAAVSDALENLREAMIDYSLSYEPINIAVQLFSREVRWLNDSLLPIDRFSWEEPLCTGMTSIGAACISLAEFIKKNTWSDSVKILIMSDGCPTDDYEDGLSQLKDLRIFKESEKYAIALGEEADVLALSQFTSDTARVFNITQMDELIDALLKLIVIPTKTSVSTGSVSSIEGNVTSLEEDEWS